METVLRVALFYFVVFAGLRIMGKREFSQLSPFELVTLLLIPELVQQAVVRDDFSIVTGLTAIATLFLLVFLTSLFSHRFEKVERLAESTPTVLVQDGRLVPRSMDLERVTPDELFSEMRKAGLERLGQVKWGILEGDGHISFVPTEGSEQNHHRPPSEPVT